MFRQGDVLIRADKLPDGLSRRNGRCVLADGEVTGHAHVAIGDGVEMYEDGDGVLWLSVPHGSEVRHEEHATITLPQGTYRVVRQREWTDAMEPRQVAD